ncbi:MULTISPECIES: class II fumarate hydratase [Vibrio]|uniref:Fumarate hydratase class II n=1 Tax=Vibrio casei TaxID=673372 RepID=A0A368LHY1_9VIBR|nr:MULTISPECIES: class II fumarate hydratase [Vibrio]RCS70327.1 class II fumarate hydratase [Vibrio casei]HBV76977.1 class II fumarate hydratase [Vibrio sp.]
MASSHSSTSTTFRIEKDSMGEVKVPQNALYQAQTQRAIDNFSISGIEMPQEFIHAIVLIKLAAAKANFQLGLLDQVLFNAIEKSCIELLDGQYADQFPIDVFQTGSGTSTNMNVNEVIASLSNKKLKTNKGSVKVSPNDHVNMGQSSNDVIPTAIQLSALLAVRHRLLPEMGSLSVALAGKANELSHIVKTGRTHLMDAMPITMKQELMGWKTQIDKAMLRIESVLIDFEQLAQGGTAVGTGINAHKDFPCEFCKALSVLTGQGLKPSENYFYNLSNQDSSVALSGELKTYSVALMKIANDLRWMNSGPLAGIGEIELVALQPGSSIMPGKVNPVIPEAVAMAAAQVMGNDTTITVAGQSGNFQLNVMLPVVAHNLLQSIILLTTSSKALAEKAIVGFTVREETLQVALAKNPILVTALNPLIGYEKAAKVAKKAYQEGRAIIDVAFEETDLPLEELERLLDPLHLTKGGIS